MKIDKLYNKYINLICKKFYLFGLIYLLLHILLVHFNIATSHFLFIFQIEIINLIEIIIFLIVNLICIFLTQHIISKILIKNPFFVIFTLIFIIPLFISYLYILYDVIIYGINLIYDNRNFIMTYFFEYTR